MAEISIEVDGGRAKLEPGQRGAQPAALLTMAATMPASAPELLRRAEEAALRLTPAPTLICLDNPDVQIEPALEAAGYTLAVAEDEMRRGTESLSADLGLHLSSLPWSEVAAPLFFHAYFESFRERPGFPGWDEGRWRGAFCSDSDFRPELSRVIVDGPEPAAFAVLWIEDDVGWVTQMGVRPGWRGQGLGEALLRHALSAFAAEGIATAALEVATNNPAARALYERMGFRVVASYRSWRKQLPQK